MGKALTNTPKWGGHGPTGERTGQHGSPEGREVGHVPVLLKEAIDFLAIKRGGTYLDATVGLGGHSCEIAKHLGAPGHLIGFDKDPAALRAAQKRLAASEPVCSGIETRDSKPDWPTTTLLHWSFAELANDEGRATYDGILADLGVSSLQLDDPARGFSFQADGKLDMRMNPMSGETAEQVVNRLGERELADVIYEFGEERRSRRIARALVRARPIMTTKQLVDVILAAARPMNLGQHKKDRIHPATRTFQALRMFINDELGQLERGLKAAVDVLAPGGRLAVIAFHSLEDRTVKRFMQRESQPDPALRRLALLPARAQPRLKLIGRKVRPGEAELARNPRARSALLRVAERLP